MKAQGKWKRGLLVLCMVFSMLAVCPAQAAAGGTMYVSETFDGATGDLAADGWTMTGNTGGATIETEDGALILAANGSTGTLKARKNVTLPEQYVISWRCRLDTPTGGLRVVVYGNGIRLFMTLMPVKMSVRTTDGTFIERDVQSEVGTWYTYTAVINGTNASISRQTDGGETEQLYENQPLQTMSGDRVELFIEGTAEAQASVDDFRIYTGLNLGDVEYFYGEEPAQELLPGETLTARAQVFYGDLEGSGDIDARFIWGLYNSRQIMMDFALIPVTFSSNNTTIVEVQFQLPDTLGDTQVWTELYLWDDEMEPMMDMAVFPGN